MAQVGSNQQRRMPRPVRHRAPISKKLMLIDTPEVMIVSFCYSSEVGTVSAVRTRDDGRLEGLPGVKIVSLVPCDVIDYGSSLFRYLPLFCGPYT